METLIIGQNVLSDFITLNVFEIIKPFRPGRGGGRNRKRANSKNARNSHVFAPISMIKVGESDIKEVYSVKTTLPLGFVSTMMLFSYIHPYPASINNIIHKVNKNMTRSLHPHTYFILIDYHGNNPK